MSFSDPLWFAAWGVALFALPAVIRLARARVQQPRSVTVSGLSAIVSER